MTKYIITDRVSYEDEYRDSEAVYSVIAVSDNDLRSVENAKAFINSNPDTLSVAYNADVYAIGNNYEEEAQAKIEEFEENFNEGVLSAEVFEKYREEHPEIFLRVDFGKMSVSNYSVDFRVLLKHDSAYGYCGSLTTEEFIKFIKSDKKCLLLNSCYSTEIAI